MEHLNAIPDSVFRKNISQYLTLHDIVNLDNACLNHEYRPVLLYKIEGMVLEGKNIIMNKDLHVWVRKRKIHLQCMLLDKSKGGMFYQYIWKIIDDFSYEHLDTFHFRGDGIATTTEISNFMTYFIAQLIIVYVLEKSFNLRHLVIEDCSFEDDYVTGFAGKHCPNLESFESSNSSYLTDESILSLATSKQKLLNVDSGINGSGIVSISTHCKDLEQTSALVVNTDIIDESIMFIPTHYTRLLRLVVGFCLLLTDASILSIAIHCPRLQHLDVSGCEQLTDASLIPISINCASLEILNISHTKLSNEGLCSIAVHCKKLIKLDVSHCSVWNYLSNPWTKESWKSIESLDVSNTDVTDLDIRVITENCSRLKSLKADNCMKTTCESFLVLVYTLYLLPIQPILENLCVMGHFGIFRPDVNYIEELNRPREEDDTDNQE